MRFFAAFLFLTVLGVGCRHGAERLESREMILKSRGEVMTLTPDTDVVLPIDEYVERRTFKTFGEYFNLRFRGYHTGDDIEYSDTDEEIEVRAIADGTVLSLDFAHGYGGVMVVEHMVANGKVVRAVYGHIDEASATVAVNDHVAKGQRLAYLGEHNSKETDRERKHLHFALYEGLDFKVNGYTLSSDGLGAWINPQDFFASYGVLMASPRRLFSGDDIYRLSFTVPAGWEVEYVPSIQALNLYTLNGAGSARERSQVFIRYFDADDFLTFSTVDIYSTTDITVGAEGYRARRYDIEKMTGVVDFPDQPSWRNERHMATDFTDGDGRFYVFAKHPDVDIATYQQLLDSMRILD